MIDETNIYDIIVIGGGPAGFTAALYAVRAGLDTLVIERLAAGGQMALTQEIDNYPGFDEGINGLTLAQKMQAGAERFGAKTLIAEVTGVKLNENIKQIETNEGTFMCRAVIIAAGAGPKRLGLKNEAELTGRGVSYCAACDGMFFKDKTVAVVGGGNSAVHEALILARTSRKVFLIHRRGELRASKIYHQKLREAANIELFPFCEVTELLHEETLSGIRVRESAAGKERDISCDGLFVSIGREPETKLFREVLQLDESGYIIADETTRTSLPGVFAAGDIRAKDVRQIVTATADGAVSAHFAQEFLIE